MQSIEDFIDFISWGILMRMLNAFVYNTFHLINNTNAFLNFWRDLSNMIRSVKFVVDNNTCYVPRNVVWCTWSPGWPSTAMTGQSLWILCNHSRHQFPHQRFRIQMAHYEVNIMITIHALDPETALDPRFPELSPGFCIWISAWLCILNSVVNGHFLLEINLEQLWGS